MSDEQNISVQNPERKEPGAADSSRNAPGVAGIPPLPEHVKSYGKPHPWAVGISVVLVLFVVGVLGAILFSTMQSRDLVQRDYYSAGLQYQETIDKEKRTESLGTPVKISVRNGAKQVSVTFPEPFDPKAITGTISLYRPSNSGMDMVFPVALDENRQQVLALDKRPKGLWKVKIEWMVGNSSFYNESELVLE